MAKQKNNEKIDRYKVFYVVRGEQYKRKLIKILKTKKSKLNNFKILLDILCTNIDVFAKDTRKLYESAVRIKEKL